MAAGGGAGDGQNERRGVKRYKLPVISKCWGCDAQRGDCS